MHRRPFLRTGLALAAVGAAGCLGESGGPAFTEGFEDGLGEWETDAAIGPEVDIADFEWAIDVSGEQAAEGERSLRIVNEGDHDDGTCWAVHPVSVESGQAYTATVTAEFWSESESFNSIRDAVMRLGPEPPETEQDFPRPQQNTTGQGETSYGGLREPLWLAEGWRTYEFEWTTPELPTETLWLALGTSVIWESVATHYVDAVTVDLAQRESGG